VLSLPTLILSSAESVAESHLPLALRSACLRGMVMFFEAVQFRKQRVPATGGDCLIPSVSPWKSTGRCPRDRTVSAR
jgi:hypothetical protein